MKIQFNINYHTVSGQKIILSGPSNFFGNWDLSKGLQMKYISEGNWRIEVTIPSETSEVSYKYFVVGDEGFEEQEFGEERKVNLTKINIKQLFIHDTWMAPAKEEIVLDSAAFSNVLIKANYKAKGKTSSSKKRIEFNIHVPRVGNNLQLCILGNIKALGNWDQENALLMKINKDDGKWITSINLANIKGKIDYKYAIYDPENKEILSVEEGFNREINVPEGEEYKILKNDEAFRFPIGNWKGAGVSVPVFSLRSKSGFGIGEFNDLFMFIDWAKKVGLKMIQILPVNETIASHNWLDSYPYKSISVVALHPIYMNLENMGRLHEIEDINKFKKIQKKINKKSFVDYPEVLKNKSKYFKLLYEQEKKAFFESRPFKKFFKDNKDWLIPYAAFAYLRDELKSPNFRTWGEYSNYDQKKILKLSDPKGINWDDIAIHYFIQFHLAKQLSAVSAYARKNGILIKGDIPIGISPNSVEAWTEPHLFNLNSQAGAPPDDFAIKGQNWGFPTYNWDKMAKEDFSWWKKRLQIMGIYFDAFRIDHILGFFRIWEIPMNAVEGLLGYFNPCIPLSTDEIRNFGIALDYDRMVKPYIRTHTLENLFGNNKEMVINAFLKETQTDQFELKEDFNNQKKINEYFLEGIVEEELSEEKKSIRNGLFDLVTNILFIDMGNDQWHPRVMFHNTSSYIEFDDYTKSKLNDLYIHFFYKRHNDFWHKQGMEKLPPIMSASDMLVCGEDLGMVPDCVPPVMDDLNILSLEIQRMPKNPLIEFAHPSDAPYLSVCTTSTHDMSTIRGWWEENRENTQRFHNQVLGNGGQAPYFAEPWICRQIIHQHLYSPAMWVTLPIQDLISIDGKLRWDETQEEQINCPSNVRHKWKFRMIQSLESLLKERSFNSLLKKMIENSGRNSKF